MRRGEQRMRIVGLRAGGTALILAATLAVPSRSVEGFRYSRTVEVDRPGLIRVPLDLDVLKHMRPDAEDLHLFAPDGRQMPRLVSDAPPHERMSAAEVLAVDRREGGWWIRIDAGAEPEPHRGLEFEFTDQTLAPGVRLESSDDGSAWRLLAETDLFRLGDVPELGRTGLVYAATAHRFLRLWWPEEAGFPKVKKILVERPERRAVEQRVERPQGDDQRTAGAAYRLRVEAPRAMRVDLRLEGEGAVGYRLTQAAAGAWKPLTEGIWHLEAGVPRTRALRLLSLGPADLRLELEGAGEARPALAAYTVEYSVRAAVFEAPEAGPYTLAYGSDRRSRAGARLPAGETAAWIEAGPEVPQPAPPLPESAVAARTPLPQVPFDSGWPVLAPGTEGGAVVRLELPAEVHRASRRSLADLRLEALGRQLPFLRWRPEVPRAAVAGREVGPSPPAEEGRSRYEMDLPGTAHDLSQLELTARNGPFRRRIRARFQTEARPGLPADERGTGWQDWTCRPSPPLPCRLAMPLPTGSGERLVLEVDDGDNPPLVAIGVDLWQRPDVLIFVWPAAGRVNLLAGNPELGAPDYDLRLAGDALRARPWREARLDLDAVAETAAGRDRLGRLVLLGALVLAAILLLALLTRTLRGSGAA